MHFVFILFCVVKSLQLVLLILQIEFFYIYFNMFVLFNFKYTFFIRPSLKDHHTLCSALLQICVDVSV